MLSAIFALAILQAAAPAAAQTPPPSPPRPKCEGTEFAAFDFWVGDWDVYPAGSDKLNAHSKVEKLYAGCAIRENWMPLAGGQGGSLSGFDPAKGAWSQTWIGSAPGPVYFTGGATDGKMVLTGQWPKSGPNGEDGLTRMTYSRVEGNAVRQHGEFSGDFGVTWQTTFDLIYRPHKE